jgi:vacuolar-type H+-ATPase catalytic subunit A/Vma1
MMKNVEELSAEVVDTAFHLHKDLGPGLLESVYEIVPARHKTYRQQSSRFSVFAPSRE